MKHPEREATEGVALPHLLGESLGVNDAGRAAAELRHGGIHLGDDVTGDAVDGQVPALRERQHCQGRITQDGLRHTQQGDAGVGSDPGPRTWDRHRDIDALGERLRQWQSDKTQDAHGGCRVDTHG